MFRKNNNDMAATGKKMDLVKEKKHPLNQKFATLEEAAKAKTDYLVNEVLKGYDLTKLQK